MSSLEMVKIKSLGTDTYGDARFAVVTVDGGHTVRGDLHRYDLAMQIAERIDAKMIYERDNGSDSLQTV